MADDGWQIHLWFMDGSVEDATYSSLKKIGERMYHSDAEDIKEFFTGYYTYEYEWGEYRVCRKKLDTPFVVTPENAVDHDYRYSLVPLEIIKYEIVKFPEGISSEEKENALSLQTFRNEKWKDRKYEKPEEAQAKAQKELEELRHGNRE